MAERRVGHRRFEQLVVDAVEFEREEKQVRGRRGEPFLHVAIELGAGRIDRIARMHQPGIGAEPSHQVVDRFVLAHRLGQRAASLRRLRQFRELTLEGILEGDAFGIDVIEVALDRRIVEAGIKVGQIPFRQRPQSAFWMPGPSLLALSRYRAAFGLLFNGFILRHCFRAHDS
jgi:hypothetical protein